MNDDEIRSLLDRTIGHEPAARQVFDDDVARGRRALRRRRVASSVSAICGVALVAGAAYGGAGLLSGPGTGPGTGPQTNVAAAPSKQAARQIPQDVPAKTLKPEYEQGFEPEGQAPMDSCFRPTAGPSSKDQAVNRRALWKSGSTSGRLLHNERAGTYHWCFTRQSGTAQDISAISAQNEIKGKPPAATTDPAVLGRYTGFVTCQLEECSNVEVTGMGVLPENVERMTFDMPDGKVVEAAIRDGRWMLMYSFAAKYGEPKALRVRMLDGSDRVIFDDRVAARVPSGQTTEAAEPPVPTAWFYETVKQHIRSKAYDGTGVSSGPGHEIAWGSWTEGKREGTVVVGVFEKNAEAEDWIDPGPDGEPCGLRPLKSGPEAGEGGFAWTSCTTENLPNGDRLRIATGKDSYAPAGGMMLIKADGTRVAISQSTGYFERTGTENPETKPHWPGRLAELPLTTEQLRAIVTDPAMVRD